MLCFVVFNNRRRRRHRSYRTHQDHLMACQSHHHHHLEMFSVYQFLHSNHPCQFQDQIDDFCSRCFLMFSLQKKISSVRVCIALLKLQKIFLNIYNSVYLIFWCVKISIKIDLEKRKLKKIINYSSCFIATFC